MSVLWIEFDLTNEPTLLPVAPHSEGCEFSQEIVKYRGIVEEAVFDCFGRPSLFGEVVNLILGRIKARIEGEQTAETANSKSPSCAFAPHCGGFGMQQGSKPESCSVKLRIDSFGLGSWKYRSTRKASEEVRRTPVYTSDCPLYTNNVTVETS